MNLNDLQFVVTIAEEKNITRAAERLFVTPSALTQMIQRLEHEMGVSLFLRSRSGCFPTEEGKVFVNSAREVVRIMRETNSRIHDIADNHTATLSVSFPPEHGAQMFSTVYSAFRRSYPNITISVRETSVRKQQAMVASGELDLGFMTLIDSQKTADVYIPLVREEMLIALPSDAEPARYCVQEAGSRFPVLDLAYLKGYPMGQLYKESTFRSWTDSLFSKAGYFPSVIIEATRPSTLLNLVATGMCGCLVTDYQCRNRFSSGDFSFFCLPSHPYWHIMACYKRGGYLSNPMKTLIGLAKEYWLSRETNLYHDGPRMENDPSPSPQATAAV